MSRFIRAAGLLVGLVAPSAVAPAADQKQIDAAIQKGADYLKAHSGDGIGPQALAGIALLEAKVPANDPAVTAITNAVRTQCYSQSRTYQITLCLMYLDRLEDPNDVPLIQMLAVRLLAGQNGNGGWTYTCVNDLTAQEVQWLQANVKPIPPEKDDSGKPVNKAPGLHPAVKEYAAAVRAATGNQGDDNSNTQFAIIAVWAARKHGVPVEASLELIEKRFVASQDADGCWSYTMNGGVSRAAMTCAGLLGLATGVARREERRAKTADKAPKEAPKTTKPNDPLFTPAAKGDEKKGEKRPEWQTAPIMKGLAGLGAHLNLIVRGAQAGERPFYTFWSIERVGVLYGLDKIGGVDWYEYLADAIVRSQRADGSWMNSDVDTSFAVMVLCRSNLTRDMSNKFRGPKDNELRAGASGGTPSSTGTDVAPMPKTPGGPAVPSIGPLPTPKEDESTKLANQLVLAPATDWAKALEKLRDAKGAENTKGLVIAIRKLDGDRKKEAREALAERLTRMSAETLRGMMTNEEPELRRGAALAAAMRDDKSHVPDLIDRLTDDDDVVVRAAYAGLKSLTSQDFGPKKGATKEECKAAAAAWRAWWAKQK